MSLYFEMVNNCSNSFIRFERDKVGRVAFLGGSITFLHGWRESICDLLENEFKGTKFDFINAGISSTDTSFAPFRLERDVFERGQVDLLFVEFAVNDPSNGRTFTDSVRGMEGIIRHSLKLNPNMDIVITYFAMPKCIDSYNNGQVPDVVLAHGKVAKYYNINTINLIKKVTDLINNNEITWEKDFESVHAAPAGQKIYQETIWEFILQAKKDYEKGKSRSNMLVRPHEIPQKPIDEFCYEFGKLKSISEAEIVNGFQINPCWAPLSDDNSETREGFVNVPMLVAESAGATLKFKFFGTAIGILVAAGKDSGILEQSIDGSEFKKQDIFTKWSSNLYIPWAYMLYSSLGPSLHELTLRISNDKNSESLGNAIRIVNFLVN